MLDVQNQLRATHEMLSNERRRLAAALEYPDDVESLDRLVRLQGAIVAVEAALVEMADAQLYDQEDEEAA